MSVFGFGASYGGVEDVTSYFLRLGVACSGWAPSTPPDATRSPYDGDAPFIEAAMRAIKSGDVIFLKSFSPGSGLRIKGVGIVTDSRPHMVDVDNGYPLDRLRPRTEGLGAGVKVRWTWPGVLDGSVFWKMGQLEDRGTNLRTGTIYEEFGPKVIAQVIELLLDPNLRQD
jgi:hypothetical protein